MVGDLGDSRLLPWRLCLQPEDRGSDRLRSFAKGLAIEGLGDPAVCLDVPVLQFPGVMLPKCLRVDVEHLGNVSLGNTETRHRLDLAPGRLIGPMRASTH